MEVKEPTAKYLDRPTYKKTEVGAIPEDWTIRELGDVVVFFDGRRRPVRDSDRAKMRGSIPYYGASGIIDYVNDYLFDEDLILLGEDGENIVSRNCRLAFRISGKAWVNNHAHVLKPNRDVSIGFLTEYLESLNYERFNSGTAQPKLNKQTCFRIQVALPPTKVEQDAIAEALNDADRVIESLQQLLTKKRQIKQGAMQELLTGKKRLPEFSGEWATSALKRFVRQFIVPMRDKPKKLNGDIPWCRIEDFDGVYLAGSKSGQHVDVETIRTMNLKVYPVGTLLVSCSADLGRCTIVARPLVSNQTFIGLEMDDAVSSNLFFYYLMTSKAEELNNLSSGTTISYLSREQFEEFQVHVPFDKQEQTAIATILADMDAELSELEAKISKVRQLKLAMTQELLSGRVRLMAPEPVDASER